MRRSARFRPLRHSPAWLLAVGLFAMALQAMGGSGLMPRLAAAGGLQMEICTGKGVGKLRGALAVGPDLAACARSWAPGLLHAVRRQRAAAAGRRRARRAAGADFPRRPFSPVPCSRPLPLRGWRIRHAARPHA
jgi:hypothetical protein